MPNLYGVRSQGGGLCPSHLTTRKGALAVTKETPPHQGNRSQQNVVAQPKSARHLTLLHARAPWNVSTGIPASVVVKALIGYPSVQSPHHKERMIIFQCLRVLGHQSHQRPFSKHGKNKKKKKKKKKKKRIISIITRLFSLSLQLKLSYLSYSLDCYHYHFVITCLQLN